eukprot:SAG31_NODE_13914_length_838_cov_0.832206_2_plen_65_part_01
MPARQLAWLRNNLLYCIPAFVLLYLYFLPKPPQWLLTMLTSLPPSVWLTRSLNVPNVLEGLDTMI